MNQGLESYAKLIELDTGDLVKAYINNKNILSKTYFYKSNNLAISNLIKEDNKIYNYDQYGNIILKDKTKFTYDASIKDCLVSIDGISVIYNKSSSIIDTYKTNRLYFEGRRLSRFVKGSMFYDFEYDDISRYFINCIWNVFSK